MHLLLSDKSGWRTRRRISSPCRWPRVGWHDLQTGHRTPAVRQERRRRWALDRRTTAGSVSVPIRAWLPTTFKAEVSQLVAGMTPPSRVWATAFFAACTW